MSETIQALQLTALRRLEDIQWRRFEPDRALSTWIVVYGGSASLVVDEREAALIPGCIAVLLPGVAWRCEPRNGPILTGYLVEITGADVGKLAACCGFCTAIPVASDVAWSLKPTLEVWLRRRESGIRNPLLASACASMLGYHLCESCRVSPPDQSLAERLKSCIDYTMYSLPTVTELAENFGVSRTTLFRVFKREYGIALKPYLQQRQWQRVCDLLHDPRLTVREAAGRCGFKSPAQFSAAFRRRFGLSPSVWRERS